MSRICGPSASPEPEGPSARSAKLRVVAVVPRLLPVRDDLGRRGGDRDGLLSLQIKRSAPVAGARACPRVPDLMYPSRTRGSLSVCKTYNASRGVRTARCARSPQANRGRRRLIAGCGRTPVPRGSDFSRSSDSLSSGGVLPNPTTAHHRAYARGSVERSYPLRHYGSDSQHSTSS